MNVQRIDLRHASEKEYAALNLFDNQMRAERTPDDPAHSLEEDIKRWQSTPPFVTVNNWIVWNGDSTEIIADAGAGFADFETNRHMMFGELEVLPAFRRQGIGRALLACVADATKQANRRLLVGETYSRVQAGEAFMKRLGAKMALEERLNQLDLADLDRELIRQWMARGKAQADEFELGFWTGSYPEEDLPAISRLMDVMNTAPRGELDMEDWHQTPARLREIEQAQLKRGIERWVAYVRHRSSGELAGFTATGWNPLQPALLEQFGTGVLPKYRNHGLGRWLKAAMLERVLRERPQVTRVRTGNADANAPMLKINTELGFKHYYTMYDWQVDLSQVEAYLKGP